MLEGLGPPKKKQTRADDDAPADHQGVRVRVNTRLSHNVNFGN